MRCAAWYALACKKAFSKTRVILLTDSAWRLSAGSQGRDHSVHFLHGVDGSRAHKLRQHRDK
jgi:hypothetical protein